MGGACCLLTPAPLFFCFEMHGLEDHAIWTIISVIYLEEVYDLLALILLPTACQIHFEVGKSNCTD